MAPISQVRSVKECIRRRTPSWYLGIMVRGRTLIIHRYDEKYVRVPGDPTFAASML